MANQRLLASLARKGGGKLVDMAVDRLFPAPARPEPQATDDDLPETPAPAPRKTIVGALTLAALTKVATRSVPGAIVIGGGYLAKKLYDRRHPGGKG